MTRAPGIVAPSLLLVSSLLVAMMLGGCAQATQIVLVVDSDLTLTSVDVDVSSTHSPPSHATADFSVPGTPTLPLTLSIYPRSSADIDVFVTVIGHTSTGELVQRDVATRFVPGSSRMLRVLLAARCRTESCDVGQTCDETGCRGIPIPGASLPEWTGTAPSLSGMPACAPVDEICNGRDDDCDTMADEDFDHATDAANCGVCGHVCDGGTCTNGFCTGEQVKHLAAGGAHTCAAAMDGSLSCWGWNEQGQAGADELGPQSSPRHVEGVTGVGTVAAGALHTCTVDATGRCGCFGDGMDGQLGRGTSLDGPRWSAVMGATSYGSVVAGVGATCAIDAAHTLVCWGANDHGQLGNGTMSPSSMPAGMVLDQVAAVAMGFQHACAVRMDGTLWCWGANDSGQCGASTGSGLPEQVPGIADATGVACGRAFTCVLRGAGAIDCMGANELGQLGNGSMASTSTPTPVTSVTDARSLSAPSAGTHACAVRATGLVACWGGNESGQLGDGTTMARATPVVVSMPTDVEAAATGGIAGDGSGHTCVLDREGRVWCWGDGSLGQLGTGDFADRLVPTLVLGAL